jgi:hypothetical protein
MIPKVQFIIGAQTSFREICRGIIEEEPIINLSCLHPSTDFKNNIRGGDMFVRSVELANYIKANSFPDDYIFQLGFRAELYFDSSRRAANRYIGYSFIKWAPDPEQALKEITESLYIKRPKYIYICYSWETSPGFKKISPVLGMYYKLELKDSGGWLYRKTSTLVK